MEHIITSHICFDGHRLCHDRYFHIRDGIIIGVGKTSDPMPADIPVTDFGNHLITPGLIDAHVHICLDPYAPKKDVGSLVDVILTAQKNLHTLLDHGITCIRDVGAPQGILPALQNAQRRGMIQGPDIVHCGQAICACGGHGWQMSKEANGVDDIIRHVRENIKEGVDQIKLMVTGGINTKGDELAPLELTEEEIRAAVSEAHRRGRKVAVHTHGHSGIRAAIEAGVDSIEHGLLMDAKLAALAKDKGCRLVPTLSAPYFAVVSGLKQEPDSESLKKSQEVMEIHRKNVAYAHQIGVSMVYGTDSGTPYNGFDTVLEEFVLLHEIGIDTLSIFQMATCQAAELLEVDATQGSLEVGKQATFLVFDQDPFQDIHQIRSLSHIILKGRKIR